MAVRLPQPRHCTPRKIIISAIATIIIFCGAWGCLIADSIRTPPKNGKQQHSSSKKKQKKESKAKFRFQTGGLIDKRYANQDAKGRVKESQLTGREDIARSEIDIFFENPIFEAGVGKGVEIRALKIGDNVQSHDEITRMLAEHGTLGILGLLILFFTPLVLYLENKFNMFLLCFVTFWFLTINHAAMRTAALAFVYSLSLLNVQLGSPRKVKKSNQ